MKPCSGPLQAHLQQGQTSLAWILKVKRVDGTTYGFTTHDQDVGPYTDGDGDAVTYLAKTALKPSGESTKSDLSVDNLEVLALLNFSEISEQDVRAHLFDDAVIEARVVNWQDLTMGDLYMRKGTLGVMKMINGQLTAELRGLSYRLSTPIGVTTGPICRAEFGSGLNGIDMNSKYLCKIDVTQYRCTGVIYGPAYIDARTLVIQATSTPTIVLPNAVAFGAADYFDEGIITFTSGILNGQSFEIKKSDGAVDNIFEAQLYLDILGPLPSAGDTLTIEPGCNKTIFDCQNKYVNIANNRSEPFIPGMDSMMDYPDAT